jgi:hypothetical protein
LLSRVAARSDNDSILAKYVRAALPGPALVAVLGTSRAHAFENRAKGEQKASERRERKKNKRRAKDNERRRAQKASESTELKRGVKGE